MKHYNFSIKPALLIVLFLLVVITAAAIGGYSFYKGQTASLELAAQVETSARRNITLELKTFLERPHDINQMNAEFLRSNPGYVRNLNRLNRRFLHFVKSFSHIRSVAFGSEYGDFIGTGRRNDEVFEYAIADKTKNDDYFVYLTDIDGRSEKLTKTIADYSPQQRSWYKAAVQANGAAWSPVYVWASQSNLGVSAVLPVHDSEGTLEGVLMAALPLGFISDYLEKRQKIYDELIYIVERSGMLIATSSSEAVITKTETDAGSKIDRVHSTESSNTLIQSAAEYLAGKNSSPYNTQEDSRYEVTISDKQYLLSVSPFSNGSGMDWFVVILTPKSTILAPISSSVQPIALVSLAILACALFLGLRITRFIIQPIIQLNHQISKTNPGEWNAVESQSHIKEVRQLAQAFNSLIKQLKGSFKKLESRVVERTQKLNKEKRRVEKALEAEREAIKQNVNFIDMISHEYRTPLTALSANLDLAEKKMSMRENPDLSSEMNRMRGAVKKMLNIFEISLHEKRIDSAIITPDMKPIALKTIFKASTDYIRNMHPGRKIEMSMSKEPALHGDSDLLAIVLSNLLDNACKYSDDSKPISFSFEVTNEDVLISIADRGRGIPDEDRDHIFEKYFRSASAGKAPGAGVGLFLVRRIVELHNGEIRVESKLGKGTTVSVLLPLEYRTQSQD